MAPRVAAVFGATGLQGMYFSHCCLRILYLIRLIPSGSSVLASVLDALLADGTFTPRAITRSPDSDASKNISARGVEVVKGDLQDKQSLVVALHGSEVVFGVRILSFRVFQDSPSGCADTASRTN